MSSYIVDRERKFPNFLILLFFVEMWERFSYYGMRALLVLFLTSYMGFEDQKAYVIYSLFAAICYTFPIFGGILADKIMGFKNMVFIGGIIIVLGHIVMSFSGNNLYSIFWGLSLIAVGTGLFKGNITNLLGACYKNDYKTRGQGFTLFYVGVNLGSFMASISCGYVAEFYGWHYGFGLAAIGMIFGLLLFIKFQYILEDVGISPRLELMDKKIIGLKPFYVVLIGGICASIFCAISLSYSQMLTDILQYFGIVVLSYYLYIAYKSDSDTRVNLLIIAIMIAILMVFFALEMQLGSLINLFTDRNIDKNIFGMNIPSSVSQAINPIGVIIIGFLVSFISSNKILDTFKILISIFAMALCFFILYIGCENAGANGQINYLYLVAGISMMSLGEVLIAPIVQSYVALFAPKKLKGLIMGMMMLALAFSNLAGLVISEFMSVSSAGGQIDIFESLEIYKSGFLKIAIFQLYIAIALIPFGFYIYKALKKYK